MISDLQGMTEADLNKLSKAEILDHILSERSTSKVTKQVGDERGMLEFEVEHYDYKGKLTGSERTTTTYNERGEVDVITKVEKDKDSKERHRTEIAHDGIRAWIQSETKNGVLVKGVEPTIVIEPKKSIVRTVINAVKGLFGRS